MKVSLILAHPKLGSFNHAIADVAKNTLESCGHDVRFHDLYQEGFNPVLPYEEIPKGAMVNPIVLSGDGIVIVHPNWWGMPPAILTGWVDRVIRPGVAYEFLEGDSGEGVPQGLLKASKASSMHPTLFQTESVEYSVIPWRRSGRTASLGFAE